MRAKRLIAVFLSVWTACAVRAEGKVANPTLDPGADMTFSTDTLEVKCSCPEKDAEIRFTTDGTPVKEDSQKWSGVLVLTETTTVKVRAYKKDMTASDEVSVTYTCNAWLAPVADVTARKDRFDGMAAAEYVGWRFDSSGVLTGTFSLKAGKAGKGDSSKVTLTLTDSMSGLKQKQAVLFDIKKGTLGGELDEVLLGKKGVFGKYGKETLTGALVAKKDADQAKTFDGVYKGQVFAFAVSNVAVKSISGAGAFTVKFSGKGKAKVSGTLMDGSKVSCSAQLIVGDKACALPVVLGKKGRLGLVLWFNAKKAAFVKATAFGECMLAGTAKSIKVGFVGCAKVEGEVPKVKQLAVSGKKVADIVCDGKKWSATGDETTKPKVSYAVKTGLFTGSYKATTKESPKPVAVKVTGVWLGREGVGTAVMKINKVTTALPVVVK